MQKENQNQLIAREGQVTFNFFDPEQFATMQRVCSLFANSELVPDMYRITDKNPEKKAIANCMIAVEISQRTGASPLMVMQNLVIIYGRPTWSSKFLIATVNTCGRFEPLKYRFTDKGNLGKVDYVEYEKVWDKSLWNGKGGYKNNAITKTFDGRNVKDIECVAYTTAKGSKEVLESSPISVRMAIEEGWYTKNGSKWRTMLEQMLIYRAASFWTNAYAPELSMGMKTEYEAMDIVDVDYVDVTEKEPSSPEAPKENISFSDQQPKAEETPKAKQEEPETKESSPEASGAEQQPAQQQNPKGGNGLFENQQNGPGF